MFFFRDSEPRQTFVNGCRENPRLPSDWTPIQNTLAPRAFGKYPQPRKFKSNAAALSVSSVFLILSKSSSCRSPINFNVTCNDSGRTQRASGANARTPSRKRVIRARRPSSRSTATNKRIRIGFRRRASIGEQFPFRESWEPEVVVLHINFFRTMSSASVLANQRMRCRSPGKFLSITSVPLSLARA